MDPQITRILLSIVLWPVLIVLYFVLFLLMEGRGIRGPYTFVWSGIGVAFVEVVWLFFLWRSQVRWTWSRSLQMWLSVPAAGGMGVLAGLAIDWLTPWNGWEMSTFLGGLVALGIWPVIVVLIWRENAEERGCRTASVACPKCGYNLTGLHDCRCPECGEQYTIDQLYAAQPKPFASQTSVV